MITDDAFLNYADKVDDDAKRRNNSRSSSDFQYEDIKWVGCETGVPLIIRAVGGAPGSKLDDTTAKIVTIAWVKADDGKFIKLIRPSFQEDSNFIINRIISKVNSVKWSNGQKSFPVKENHPDIYNLIEKNGYEEGDPKYNFDKGWKGKEVIIMNVIDRQDMEWHMENKHTKLLAKSVTIGTNGSEFVDEGVSSYSVNPTLAHLFRSYGSWEKYDLGFTRTGNRDLAYRIINATNSRFEIQPVELQKYISTENHLTQEEESWERYDLNKLYKVTTYSKLFNRLKNTILKIDVALGTDFLPELKELSERESKEKAAEKENADSYTSPTIEEEIVEEVTVAPVRTRQPISAAPSENYVPYIEDAIKGKLISVDKVNDEWKVDWDYPIEQLAACPDCGFPSPLEAKVCPHCGAKFD